MRKPIELDPSRFAWIERRGRNEEGDRVDVLVFVDGTDSRILAEIVIPDSVNDYNVSFNLPHPWDERRCYLELEPAKRYAEQVCLFFVNGKRPSSPSRNLRRREKTATAKAIKLKHEPQTTTPPPDLSEDV